MPNASSESSAGAAARPSRSHPHWRTREQLERCEEQQLAPYAEHAAQSRGRRYPAVAHPYRTAFQVDRDRIMYTTAFRRLQYKTQVFVYHEGDYYRSRLTHTSEAAQIARTIARALGANEDLSEAITLAHDLGHPPFGHTGERILDELLLTRRGLDPQVPAHRGRGFNHTLQSLRIVEILERRWPDHPGLNLTWETREGIVKHATPYDQVPIEWAAEYMPSLRPSLEAQIVNAADQLAYSAHDLDDGLRSGLIRMDMPELTNLEIWLLASDGVTEREPELRRHLVLRRLTDILISDLIYTSAERIAAAQPTSCDEVRHHPVPMIGFSPAMAAAHAKLTEFLNDQLYQHPRVQQMFQRASAVLVELFEAFEAEPTRLPLEYQPKVAPPATASDTATGETEALWRAVTDYLAGMTDRFALQEHRRICRPGG